MTRRAQSEQAIVGLSLLLVLSAGSVPVLGNRSVVNVDAQANAGPDMYAAAVQVPVAAGTWQVALRDDPTDQYDGWSPWSSDDDPAAQGRPWRWGVRVDVPGQFSTNGYWAPNTTEGFPTQQQALAANLGGPPLTFTLSSAGTVYFWMSDGFPWDKRGGVTVTLVPEPSSVGLSVAFAALLLRRRCA